MTTQICPKCKERGFTWSLDEEPSKDTIWYCSLCQYTALEDESLQLSDCPQCQAEKLIYLKDDGKTYFFGLSCGYLESAKTEI
jgi:hypothetical protein